MLGRRVFKVPSIAFLRNNSYPGFTLQVGGIAGNKEPPILLSQGSHQGQVRPGYNLVINDGGSKPTIEPLTEEVANLDKKAKTAAATEVESAETKDNSAKRETEESEFKGPLPVDSSSWKTVKITKDQLKKLEKKSEDSPKIKRRRLDHSFNLT
jgi:hypothetical protein